MVCRQCGTEIADKAIVCYRCGTATTEARFKPAQISGRRSRPIVLVALLMAVVLALLAVGVFVQGCPVIDSVHRDGEPPPASARLDNRGNRVDLLGAAA
jgi:hypothetical protein